MIIIIIVASIVKRGGEKKSGNDPGGIIGTGEVQIRISASKTKNMKSGFVSAEKCGGYTMATKKPYTSRILKNQWIFGMKYGCL